jgi:hypothetical protein
VVEQIRQPTPAEVRRREDERAARDQQRTQQQGLFANVAADYLKRARRPAVPLPPSPASSTTCWSRPGASG